MNKTVLNTLLEISKDLANDRGLRANLASLLESLADDLNTLRSFILLYRPETDKLDPVATSGLNISEFRRLEFRVEKSPIRRVFETGEALTIAHLGNEAAFDFLVDDHVESSLICVPISLGEKILGVLGVETPYQKGSGLSDLTNVCSIVASMISQLAARRGDSRERAAKTDRGKFSPAPGVKGKARFQPHHRQFQPDAAGLRPGNAGRAHQT